MVLHRFKLDSFWRRAFHEVLTSRVISYYRLESYVALVLVKGILSIARGQ